MNFYRGHHLSSSCHRVFDWFVLWSVVENWVAYFELHLIWFFQNTTSIISIKNNLQMLQYSIVHKRKLCYLKSFVLIEPMINNYCLFNNHNDQYDPKKQGRDILGKNIPIHLSLWFSLTILKCDTYTKVLSQWNFV
jgi:hypothetical protein